jgi:hypothetical protein
MSDWDDIAGIYKEAAELSAWMQDRGFELLPTDGVWLIARQKRARKGLERARVKARSVMELKTLVSSLGSAP